MSPAVTSDDDLRGIGLRASQLEVRLARANIKQRLFSRRRAVPTLGRFEIVRRIGVGGMGVVYEALDPQLERKVALKVMREDRASNWDADLLRREAQGMAKLSHPNVVPVFDAGVADGRVYVAMAYVPAPNLREWVQTKRSPVELLQVLRQAGLGLAAAHDAGLVHCDFKPENVLVPDDGPARVTDFGLARVLDPSRASLPGDAPLAGTPVYMSPQRMRGETIDARDDQWAFCVTCFELLGGRRPFARPERDRLRRGASVELPDLPSEVPGNVARAIRRGLSPRVEDRFPGMPELLSTLTPPRPGKRWELLAAALGLSLVGGWWFTTRSTDCPRSEDRLQGIWDAPTQNLVLDAMQTASPSLAKDTWARLSPLVDRHVDAWLDSRRSSCLDAQRGEVSAEQLDRTMACLDRQHAELEAFVDVLASADPAAVRHAVVAAASLESPQACREAAGNPDVRPAVTRLRTEVAHARAQRRAGQAKVAEPRLDAAVAKAERLDDRQTQLEALYERGLVRMELARHEEAVADFEQVIERSEGERSGTIPAEAALALVEVVGAKLDRPEEGLAHADMASMTIALAGNDPIHRARLELARGRMLDRAGRSNAARLHATAGLSALDTLETTDAIELHRAEGLRVMAKIAFSEGEAGQADRYASDAREIFERVLGPNHPEIAETLNLLGAANLRRGRVEDSIERFEGALEILAVAYGTDHPAYGRALGNLGAAFVDAGKHDEARKRYEQALAIQRAAFGDADSHVASIWINIGGLEHSAGNLDAAVAAFERAFDTLSIAYGPEHPHTLVALTNLGRMQFFKGDLEASETSLLRALSIRERDLGPDHLETARARHAWGVLQLERGRTRVALEAFEAVAKVYDRVDAAQFMRTELEANLATARTQLGGD